MFFDLATRCTITLGRRADIGKYLNGERAGKFLQDDGENR